MHAVSQIIERNLHRRQACTSALWINPEKDSVWQQVKDTTTTLKLLCQDYGSFEFLQNTGADAKFAAFPLTGEQKYEWILVNLPRQKALLGMILDYAASLLTEEGTVWLTGENKAGIKSANKQLKLNFHRVRKLDNARHCVLYEACGVSDKRSFDLHDYRLQWVLDCKPSPIQITSYPGVFAHGRLDAGTALLLEALADVKFGGDVLDFACGAGVIGTYIAANYPGTCVHLLDTSALALQASEETLTNNHLKGKVLASDGLSGPADQFDFIVSNPPIHSGVKTDNRLSMRLLQSVHQHLKPGGVFVMVANVHLPYEAWLSQRFSFTHELIANRSYKVLLSKK
jgi:16S rRNA (guanine1207-N2)-methyltransferase